jgi:hypothetical protein
MSLVGLFADPEWANKRNSPWMMTQTLENLRLNTEFLLDFGLVVVASKSGGDFRMRL